MCYWLKCELNDGMSGGEVAVQVDTVSGKKSLFTPTSKVQRVAGAPTGLLMVEVLDRDARFGLVQLPSGSIEGSRIVKVDNTLLVEK